MVDPRKCEDCGCKLDETEESFCENCHYGDEETEFEDEDDE